MNTFRLIQLEKKDEIRPLQICWYAATLKNFINFKKCSKQEVMEIDISVLCDEIEKGMISNQEESRFTFYLSTQLTYGALVIHRLQTDLLEDSCQNMILKITVFSESSSKKKTKKGPKKDPMKGLKKDDEVSKSLSIENIPEVNIVSILSEEDIEDIHLIKEADTIPSQMALSFGSPQSDVSFETLSKNLQTEINRQDNSTDEVLRHFESSDIPYALNDSFEMDKSESRKMEDLSKTPTRGQLQNLASTLVDSPPLELVRSVFSPPKKRSKLPIIKSPISLFSPRRAMVTDESNVTMAIVEPIQEATLPTDSSTMQKSIPLLPPLGALEANDETATEKLIIKKSLNNVSISQDPTSSNIETQRVATHKNYNNSQRRKRKFFDDKRQIEIVERPPTAFTFKTADLVTNLTIQETASFLFTAPSTMKRKMVNEDGRFWSNTLFHLYNKNLKKPRYSVAEYTKVEILSSTIITKDVKINVTKLDLNKLNIKTNVLPKNKTKDNVNEEQLNYAEVDINEEPADSLFENQTNDNVNEEQLNYTEVDVDQEPMNLLFEKKTNVNVNEEQLNYTEVDVDEEPVDLLFENKTNDNVNEEQLNYTEVDVDEEPADLLFEKKTNDNVNEEQLNYTEFDEDREPNSLISRLPLSEFFALVTLQWKKAATTKIAFHKVINPKKYSSIKVFRYLMCCLHLETKGKLYLEQKKPYATIYLIKPQ